MTQILISAAILGSVGLLGGLLLAVVSTICDKGEKNERLADIRDALPGANCGACGYAGCDSYAEAVDKGECEPGLCAPGGNSTAAKLSEILGIEIENTPKVAVVTCNGCTDNVDTKYNYLGIKTCSAAVTALGGPSFCSYGCIGFGDCLSVCNFNAIQIENGLAKVNTELCTGCGACAKACPKQIIKITPKKTSAFVACSNTEKGAAAKKVCKTACIGCGICAKKCEYGAITVENFLAVIDGEKCTVCGACATACPQKIIEIR